MTMTVPKIKRKKTNSSLRLILYISIFAFCLFIALYLYARENIIVVEESSSSSKIIQPKVDDAPPAKKSDLRGSSNNSSEQKEDYDSMPKSITFNTSQGDIHIKLRPDLSRPSVEYIKRLLDSPRPCDNCRFYRVEKPGILQGIIAKKNVKPNIILGDCPEGLQKAKHECPGHDPNCGCHGPIMKRGMIGWAAGEGGPDFFIDTYVREATWWNTDHTVWGEIADEESLKIVMGMYELPSTKRGLTFLDKPVHIDIISS